MACIVNTLFTVLTIKPYILVIVTTFIVLVSYSKRYTDPENQAVVKKLMIEARANDETVTSTYVRG